MLLESEVFEGAGIPLLFTSYQQLNLYNVRGRTGKGANLSLFGGANMALCSARTNRVRLSFPDSFSLVRFFWRCKRTEESQRDDELGEAK
jgi:hypothetical protein